MICKFSKSIFITLVMLLTCHQFIYSQFSEPINLPTLTVVEANKLAELPLACLQKEYPNKLGQTLSNASEIREPSQLHPAFYGCFDWHSSVHGHWSLVTLVKAFPKLEKRQQIIQLLSESLTKENIQKELQYFKRESEKSFERTYGWAWLLQLQLALNNSDVPEFKLLADNLQVLTDYISQKYIDYLPKLVYPIRVGEHTNTAFGLSFAYDYAKKYDKKLSKAIETRAREFYLNDRNCPISWEPSGYDFLSPCLQGLDLMRKILSKQEFLQWSKSFLPDLFIPEFELQVGIVGDRTDGKLVHLDGLNFSRAWVMRSLANQYPDVFGHLHNMANQHIIYSYPFLINDDYEGGHWLASFAIYALLQGNEN